MRVSTFIGRSTLQGRHRRRHLSGVGVATALLVVTAAAPAQATYYSGGFGSGFMYIRPYSYNTIYQNAMNQAIANWNNTLSSADIQKLSGASNTVTAASYPSETWNGIYNRYSTYFSIRLNSSKLSGYSNVSNAITSVLVHEFGHALYLADNPPTSSTGSIMREDRNRNTMTVPTQYDVDEVNAYN